MKGSRPKSAKPGTKIEYHEESSHYSKDDQSSDEDQKISLNKKGVSNKERLLSANYRKLGRKVGDMGSGVLGRILPKNIPQDKERLYFEAIKLKQEKHEIQDENMKLKTKITILERENDRLGKKVEMQDDFGEIRSKSRVNSNIGSAVESSKIPAMKRLIRESKDEVEYLKTENQKIRKSVKYTKLSELQNENKILIEEMNKMSALIDDLTAEQSEQEFYQRRAEELDSFLKTKLIENQDLQAKNRELEDELYQHEDNAKSNFQKTQERERKLIKDMEISKRKLEGAHKEIDNLKLELNKTKNQKISFSSAMTVKDQLLTRNSRNPERVTTMKIGPTQPEKEDLEKKRMLDQLTSMKKKSDELEQKNSELLLSLKAKEQKLAASEREIQGMKSVVASPTKMPQEKDVEKRPKIRTNESVGVDEYAEDFDEGDNEFEENQNSEGKDKIAKEKVLKKESDQDEEEILYQEEEQPKQTKSKSASGKKKPAKKKDQVALKSLLTYRMKAQRYCFEELKQDIEETGQKEFKVAQVDSMLHNSPFFLNEKQAKILLKLVSPEDFKKPQATIQVSQLVSQLRTLIEDFQLLDQNEDDEMYLRVAQMVTTYASELETAFDEKKNIENDATISEKSIRELFQQLQLESKYVDLIVAELSLVSEDLDHLDYGQFFNRFYIDKEMGVEELDEEYEEDNSKTLHKTGRIQEEQLEESEDSKSKSKTKFNRVNQ